ncbi:site-specific integrase [Amycolatopsis sp. NBC_01480]|uniref:site-specific integrase n=1 Tax=Amycolatopsis sp. NBC_01480 TaxID=2903562 RepID=UPI002E29EB13|nr:site-specific integrase [Amycolatopsis sp. NBC_01480]
MTMLERWRVCTTPAQMDETSVGGHRVGVGWAGWLRSAPMVAGAPFVLSPEFEYDVRLNGFFASARMRSLAERTQHGYARDLAAFLTFLWSARARRRWNQAQEEDHLAYLHWRRHDQQGPRVSGSTWNRELAAVNQFYRWAIAAGYVEVSPVPQSWRRPGAAGAGWASRSTVDEQRPATYSRDIGPARVPWIPIADYRLWRDIGVRGFDTDGPPRADFRGRWSSRNAVFCDLMIRTGLRLGEQSALTVAEFPLARNGVTYRPFELSAATAKGGSGRTVYVPAAVAAEVAAYVRCDRAEVVEQARSSGRYAQIADPLVIDQHGRGGQLLARDRSGRTVRVANLPWEVRRRLLVETAAWNAQRAALARIARHLDRHGTPIDYARRRALDCTDLLPEPRWETLLAHTGFRRTTTLRSMRCLLFEALSGRPASTAPEHYAPRTKDQREAFADLPVLLTARLAAELHLVAAEFLADHAINEPVSWQPPRDLATGLDLPGPDPGTLPRQSLTDLLRAAPPAGPGCLAGGHDARPPPGTCSRTTPATPAATTTSASSCAPS